MSDAQMQPSFDMIREQYKAGRIGAKHVLIIGQTKVGKSDWSIQAALDGFHVIYVDADNGLETIMTRTQSIDADVATRIHYFRPPDMLDFISSFVTDSIFRWNMTQNRKFVSMQAQPDDMCVEILPSRLPNNVILVIDGWTSLASSAMNWAARGANVDLSEIAKYGREIYGPANYQLTYICECIRGLPYHCIVQAHPAQYERKEKPEGSTVKETKEADMIIREVVDIPMSSSNPHGYNMGGYFTAIGWMKILRNMGKRELDFEVQKGRISGGSIATKGDPRTTHSFKNLFFPNGVPETDMGSALKYFKAADFSVGGGKPATQTATPATKTETPKTPVALPTTGKLTFGKK